MIVLYFYIYSIQNSWINQEAHKSTATMKKPQNPLKKHNQVIMNTWIDKLVALAMKLWVVDQLVLLVWLHVNDFLIIYCHEINDTTEPGAS